MIELVKSIQKIAVEISWEMFPNRDEM